MKIHVITSCYNEARLVPHFLNHYLPWVDWVHVFYTPGTDNTLELLTQDRVKTYQVEFPDGFDDARKTACLNWGLKNIPATIEDWFIVVDFDELVWPHVTYGTDPTPQRTLVETKLNQIPPTWDAARANMWQVYRTLEDKDLDPASPPAIQRRHGTPCRDKEGREGYRKPCVIRGGRMSVIGIGQHALDVGCVAPPYFDWDGAHWNMADPSWIMDRKLRDRRDRLSQENIRFTRGIFILNYTEKILEDAVKEHWHDPAVF